MIAFLNPAQQPNGGISHVTFMYNLLVTELFSDNIVNNVVDFPQIGDFLEYFEDTWMINVIPWNLFHLNDNDIRTNNQLEGWHNKMKIIKTMHNNNNNNNNYYYHSKKHNNIKQS